LRNFFVIKVVSNAGWKSVRRITTGNHTDLFMKKTTFIAITFLFIGFLINGCANTHNTKSAEKLTTSDRVRQFDNEFYNTFNTINNTLQNEGFTVETADSDNGLIFTDYQLASTVGAPISGNAQVKVEAVLERGDNGTQVTLTLRVQQEVALTGGESKGVSQAEAKQYYEKLFKRIEEQL